MNSIRPITFFLLFFSAFYFLPSALIGQRPTIGLVLSGGGAAGLAHIGVIKVIEEAGIPIDYVGGSSMGSIVGAMYAIGYTPDEMARLVGEQDWEALLTDEIPRNDMSFEFKEELEKYFYSFPVSREGIKFPTGLVAGHNITNMLAGLTWPAYHIRDFNQLPRPYLCIGADIVTGEEVVLTGGILHDAMRASMAIPTAFTPVEVHGKLLVDGGFINNFPAEHVKAMGADILIGIDVQRDLFSKNELDNMINLLKQVSTLTREDINARNRELCDVLIRTRTPGASTLTFGLADSIVRHGERTAREHWETLKALGEQIRQFSGEEIKAIEALPKIDSVYVREIGFVGLKNVTSEYVQSKMNLPFPAWLSAQDIYRAMQRIYGTDEFIKVTYQLEKVPGGTRLVVRAVEKNKDLIHVGFHYDNLFNASLMAKAELRNLWKKGDKVSLNLTLGENPNLTASYFFLTRLKRNYGIKAELNQLHAYDYSEGKKINSYLYRDALVDLILRTSILDKFAVSMGLQGEFASVAPDVSFLNLKSYNSKMVNYYTRFLKDDLNSAPYPTKGEKVDIMLKLVNNFTDQGHLASMVFDYRHRRAFELGRRISFQPALYVGMAFGDSIPYPYKSYVGGLGYYHKSVIPFVGLNYMERAADYAVVLRADIQVQIKGNHYVSWRSNVGKSFNTFAEFRGPTSSLSGTGLTYGYASQIGPIEITLMSSTHNWKPILFFNLGYWIR